MAKTPVVWDATVFLGEGEWTAEMFRDVGDAPEDVRGFVHETRTVKAGETMSFHMAPGGGFVVRFVREGLAW